MPKNYKRNYNDNKSESKIKLKAYYLWQDSIDVNPPEYYWYKAKNLIEIEKSKDVYDWYSPRKWCFLFNNKCLKFFSKILARSYFLSVIERLTILSALIGLFLFVREETQRRDQFVLENWRNIAEATELSKTSEAALASSAMIRNSLQKLNRPSASITQIVNFASAKELWDDIQNQPEELFKFKYYPIRGKCEKSLKVPFWPPRWPTVYLSELKLPEGVKLDGIWLCSAMLEQAKLNNVNLDSAKLAGAWLVQAQLINTDLKNGDLRNANLNNANLAATSLKDANLSGADLTEANLTCLKIEKKLKCADLSGADLTEANLNIANLEGANLTAANIEGANLDKIEVNNLIKSQLKLACNWDKANYIFRQTKDNKWEVDTEENQRYIKEEIRNDKASDPQTSVDCSKWDKKDSDG